MDEDAIIQYITAFEGVYTVSQAGNTFFFYDPTGKFTFATLMTNDDNDQFSNLTRPGIFRLNIGVTKETFQAMFGPRKAGKWEDQIQNSTYDFTALDKIMPHPVYGMMYWVCVLNPSEETFREKVEPLLAEAYRQDVAKHTKMAHRS